MRAAGIGGEPKYQRFLRNPVSTYIGDISYSLYLVHWPIIIFAATLMDTSGAYYLLVVALAFALAIGSYHFVENPLRRADATRMRARWRDIRKGRFVPQPATIRAGIAAVALLAVALTAYAGRPDALELRISARVSPVCGSRRPVVGLLVGLPRAPLCRCQRHSELDQLSDLAGEG